MRVIDALSIGRDNRLNYELNRPKIRLVLPFAALALVSCNQIGPQWNGWVYPNGIDLTRDVPIGRFDTLEECRTSARTIIANINLKDSDGEPISSDYECGRSCKREDEPGGLNICEETSK